MSSKDILIAEFMGFQKTSMGWFDADEHLCLPNTSDNTFDELDDARNSEDIRYIFEFR